MASYGSLAGWYDRLTSDVDYSSFADYYEKQFSNHLNDCKLLLDLCCGTGTLTYMMAERGYELIAVDASPEMLMEAQSKAASLENAPLFICQSADELDLYGTVDAAYSSLDSINYITPEDINEVFHRLSLFIRPDGLLIFDVRIPEWLKGMDGIISVDEDSDVFCVWRADFCKEDACLVYGMDLFTRRGSSWKREQEEHVEYLYSDTFLRNLLSGNHFHLVSVDSNLDGCGDGRIFYTAIREKE